MLYKKSTVKEGLLRYIRQRAGLGDPPSQFTTNASESVNALLKNKLDYKKLELTVFLDKLKEVIDEQEKELQRAVIDHGKYRFCTDFQHLVKKQSDWFLKMSAIQKEAHLTKVAKANLRNKFTSNISNLPFILSDDSDEAHSSDVPQQLEKTLLKEKRDYSHQLMES